MTVATTPPKCPRSTPRTGGVATVNFDGRSSTGGGELSYSWDFNGDGVVDSTSDNPGDHSYTTAGTRTVELRVSGPAGTSIETKTALVRVFDSPLVANFTATPLSGAKGLTVVFSDQTSGNATNWEWDFENDSTPDSVSRNPTHTYTSGGFKDVRLIASVPDPVGETAFNLSNAQVKAAFIQIVEADFSLASAGPFTIGQGQTGVNVSFTDKSLGLSLGGQTRWDWDFGDGNTFTTSTDGASSPTHEYTSAGTFSVELQVTDPAGTHSKTSSSLVTVIKAPVADFSGTPTQGAVPLEVQLADSSVNSPTSWAWDVWEDTTDDDSFNVGNDTQVKWNQVSSTLYEQSSGGAVTTITVQSPLLRFKGGGTFHVRLTAATEGPAEFDAVRESLVEVLSSDFEARLSGGNFSQNVLTLNTGDSVEFKDLSQGTVTSRAWDVNNDGVTDSTLSQFTFTFAEGGRFPVSLKVIGPAGSATEVKGDTSNGFVNVGSTPEVDFNAISARFGAAPLTVSLRDQSVQDGLRDPTSWAWTVWKDTVADGVLDEGADEQVNTSSSQNPTFIISDGGDFHVKLVASNEGGSSSNVEPLFIRTIQSGFSTVGAREADLTQQASLSVTFVPQVTGSVDSFAWDLDGDGLTDSTSQNPTFTYSVPGSFAVKLIATGPAGTDEEFKVDYIKTFTAPSAEFTFSPDKGAVPLTISFTDRSVGNPTAFAWTFFQDLDGDGQPGGSEIEGQATSQNPSFTFQTGGTFSVRLIATNPGHEDPNTDPDILETKLNVIVSIRANFSPAPSSGAPPLDVTFTDQSEGEIQLWVWDFGDGSPIVVVLDDEDPNRNPQHTYLTQGTFTAKLTVLGPAGTSILTQPITASAFIPPPP
ncbi:MAG: PKD domain-containing protein, partial [Chloroflexi bacterium]|nr:PKD domain-containing protein [Chloroflexota bacterium]